MDEEKGLIPYPQDSDLPIQKKEYKPITPTVKKEFFESVKNQYGSVLNPEDQELDDGLLLAVVNTPSARASKIARRYSALVTEREIDDKKITIKNGFQTTAYFVKSANRIEVQQISDHNYHYGDAPRTSSRNLDLQYDEGSSDFYLAVRISRYNPEHQPSNALDYDSLILNYTGGELSKISMNSTYNLNDRGTSLGLDQEHINSLGSDRNPIYGPDTDIVKINGHVHITVRVDNNPTLKAVIPQKADIASIQQSLFPEEEPVPEKDVPWLRQRLGIWDVPYTRPFLFSHPDISRTNFPKDASGNHPDLDRSWRSTDIAKLIGVSVNRE